MIVYSYDPLTMEFAGAADAFESPLEPGVFPLPANSTTLEPPAFDSATQVCVFDGAAWSVHARTETPVPPNPTPDEVKSAQMADLLAARVRDLTASDWYMSRHHDELMMGVEPTLAPARLSSLLVYRQALRDLPKADGFPGCGLPVLTWPTSP